MRKEDYYYEEQERALKFKYEKIFVFPNAARKLKESKKI